MRFFNREKTNAEMREDHYFARRVYHIPFIDQLLGRVTNAEDRIVELEIIVAELSKELDDRNA